MKALSSLQKRKAAKMMHLQLKRTMQNLLQQIRQNVSQNNPELGTGILSKNQQEGKCRRAHTDRYIAVRVEESEK